MGLTDNLEWEVPVSAQDLQALRDALSHIDFWNLPTTVHRATPDGTGDMQVCGDGTLDVVEAVFQGSYHIVAGNCGDKERLRPVIEVFKRIAWPHLPDNVDDYVL